MPGLAEWQAPVMKKKKKNKFDASLKNIVRPCLNNNNSDAKSSQKAQVLVSSLTVL
jgi:hypothetical protein